MFLAGVGVFTVFSFQCGVSQNPSQLIAFRALQGVGGALLIPETGPKMVRDAREGDVHHRVVEHRHGEGEAHRQQDDDLLPGVLPFESEHPHLLRLASDGASAPISG